MGKVIEFIKKESVLCIALMLALLSCFFVVPSAEYISYIDFRTLCLLFCLMAVMKGFQETGLFSYLANSLLNLTKTLRQTTAVLILLCFFSSMIITNDVALITFVPFAIETLTAADRKKHIIFTVTMQTIAANLGSMLTPIGNPQNLYLYSLSGISAFELMKIMLPYTVVSLVGILMCLMIFKKDKLPAKSEKQQIGLNRKNVTVYSVLFIICMLTVARIVPYIVTTAIVIALMFIHEKTILKKVDYSLLLTFVGFFIFVGNMGNIGSINSFLQGLMEGNEFIISVISSQVISNVPAAILLSGFTDKYQLLLAGTNIGGLGTLIASMASLISYKYIANYSKDEKNRYFMLFTVMNIVFLAVLILCAFFMNMM